MIFSETLCCNNSPGDKKFTEEKILMYFSMFGLWGINSEGFTAFNSQESLPVPLSTKTRQPKKYIGSLQAIHEAAQKV